MLIEVHMLKNYAPSNLNRDETGSPKSCIFGGEPRGRISSQCQKRNLRISDILRSNIDTECFGVRTRKLAEIIVGELKKEGIDEAYLRLVAKKITGFGNKEGKESKDDLTAQMMFFSPADIQAVTHYIIQTIEKAGTVKEFEKVKAKDLQSAMKDAGRPITLDMALFGRMVTSDAFRDVEASMQVAHAVSTNRLEREFDYYTAMDDLLKKGEETGAGMIGDVEFSSNCYYHYFNIDVDQLRQNLNGASDIDDLVSEAIPALVRAFAYVNPSGKQNSFAAHQLPSLLCVEIKPEKIPVSYINAFVKPVSPTKKSSLVDESVIRLVQEIDKADAKFDITVNERLWFSTEDGLSAPQTSTTMNNLGSLITELKQALREAV